MAVVGGGGGWRQVDKGVLVKNERVEEAAAVGIPCT